MYLVFIYIIGLYDNRISMFNNNILEFKIFPNEPRYVKLRWLEISINLWRRRIPIYLCSI